MWRATPAHIGMLGSTYAVMTDDQHLASMGEKVIPLASDAQRKYMNTRERTLLIRVTFGTTVETITEAL